MAGDICVCCKEMVTTKEHTVISTTPLVPPGATAARITTTNTYDALGHLKTVTAPLGPSMSYVYDANGNKLSETNANGHTTSYLSQADTIRCRPSTRGCSLQR